jgi:hypothetical protein
VVFVEKAVKATRLISGFDKLDERLKIINQVIVNNVSPKDRDTAYASAIMMLARFYLGKGYDVHEVTILARVKNKMEPLKVTITY